MATVGKREVRTDRAALTCMATCEADSWWKQPGSTGAAWCGVTTGGWDGRSGSEPQEGGDHCKHTAESQCCTAETIIAIIFQ